MMYKVWTSPPREFADLQKAIAFASDHYRRTGVVVGVTERPKGKGANK